MKNERAAISAKGGLSSLRLNARILMICGLPLIATALITTNVIHWSTRRLVEDAIGEQMVMPAQIVSHLIAMAEQQGTPGMSSAEINLHSKEITRFAKEEVYCLMKRDGSISARALGKSACESTRALTFVCAQMPAHRTNEQAGFLPARLARRGSA